MAQDLKNRVPDFLESGVWEEHSESMPGGGTDDKPAKAGDIGTAKGKVRTDYQRLARSTAGTQFKGHQRHSHNVQDHTV